MVRNLRTLSSGRAEQHFDLVLRLKVPPCKLSDAYNSILPVLGFAANRAYFDGAIKVVQSKTRQNTSCKGINRSVATE